MEQFSTLGRWLVIAGILLTVIGGLVWLAGRFFPSGQIPGTIRIETGGFTCVFPLLGSIILSIVLTIILNIVARLMR